MKLRILFLLGAVTLTGACSDYLDVNTNPNGPQTVTANFPNPGDYPFCFQAPWGVEHYSVAIQGTKPYFCV